MTRLIPALLVLLAPVAGVAQGDDPTSTLPIVLIDTGGSDIPDEPKTMAQMRVVDNGPGEVNTASGAATYEGWIGIELRGSSSSRFPKKQYGVETRHEDGSNRNVSLLGLPEENDWVLHAPYSDKSLLRNALAFEMGARTGRYASRYRFCEVILDGDYQGVYLLLETIKDDGDRVDLSDTDRLGGGYIAKLDKRTGSDDGDWPSADPATGQFVRYQFHDPEGDELTAEQRSEIEASWDAMEQATLADDIEAATRPHLDWDSLVDYVIVSEVAKNIDAYRISVYVHRPALGAPIHAGPLWDFNLAFGNADYGAAEETSGFQYATPYTSETYPIPSWFSRVVESDPFRERLRARWSDLRAGPFATDALTGWIDETTGDLDEAQVRNFDRWPILDRDIWPNATVRGSYAGEVGYLRSWLTDRLAWLDGQWLAPSTSSASIE